jgi:hypothetical protein
MFTPKRTLIPAAALCAALGLSACGGGSRGTSHSSSQQSNQQSAAARQTPTQATDAAATSPTSGPSAPDLRAGSPEKVLAVVDGHPVKLATVLRMLELRGKRTPLPDPPSYSACIARHKAAATNEGATAAEKAEAQKSEAELKESCSAEDRKLFGLTLSAAIHNQWLIGEARDQGIHVSNAEVQQEFELSKKGFHRQGEFELYLKNSGQSVADMKSDIKLGKLTTKIFKAIEAKEHRASSADVARFYATHRKQFAIPEGRTVRIIRTTSMASALNAKAELKAGKSFAQMAKQLSEIGQPITSKNGEVADLKPQTFGEKPLKDSIFTAKLHRIYGPVTVKNSRPIIAPEAGTGFYVFEVTAIVPGGQTPLSSVKGEIAEELDKADKEKTLRSAIAAFHRKWTGLSDCKPGYVVENCRQFKIKVSERDDPFVL